MTESNFASLNPELLARKGGAKPAMRARQNLSAQAPEIPAQDEKDQAIEDLGWNDMGGAPPAGEAPSHEPSHGTSQEDTSHKAQSGEPDYAEDDAVDATSPLASPARKQQEGLAAKLQQHNDQPRTKRETLLAQSRRAAFTLRLDASRHLKLRLATTMQGVSAQKFVTQALDQALAQIEELEAIAEQIKPTG